MTNDEMVLVPRAELQQALEALESPPDYIVTMKGLSHDYQVTKDAAIAALRDRLAQRSEMDEVIEAGDGTLHGAISYWQDRALKAEKMAQSQATAWDEGYQQGVADECTSEANIGVAGFGAKVKPARQNPYTTTSDPRAMTEQAEPVACVTENSVADAARAFSRNTAPPTRTPLTDEQINDVYGDARVQHQHIPHDDVVRIARAIELAHGIGEKK